MVVTESRSGTCKAHTLSLPIPLTIWSKCLQGVVVSMLQLASTRAWVPTFPCCCLSSDTLAHGVKALCIWWKAWRTRRSAIPMGKGVTWFSCTSITLGWWQKVSWQATGHWESGTHMDAHSVMSCAHSTPPKADGTRFLWNHVHSMQNGYAGKNPWQPHMQGLEILSEKKISLPFFRFNFLKDTIL